MNLKHFIYLWEVTYLSFNILRYSRQYEYDPGPIQAFWEDFLTILLRKPLINIFLTII